ncbi:MAG: hypothetical protein GX817_01475 [Elusimicrobia bacterium]|nr:hypothetical protein [Elusimicrobiota bacterium]
MNYISLKEERIRLDSLPFFKALGSAVLMGGIIYFAGFNVFMGIPVDAFLYMGLILILKAFDKA